MTTVGNGTILDPEVYFAASLLLFALTLLLILIVWIKLRRMKKRYKQLLNGTSSTNVEELLIGMQARLDGFHEGVSHYSKAIDELQEQMKTSKTKVEVHRYNAFHHTGSDLSFSIAIVNEYQDGLVLTGIHSREETYLYVKPLEKGQSKYALSPEEKHVIGLTASKKE
ncbi:DUF4446 family protein [Paenibacillus sp. CC-CFT747]|nr:DUF4446 family protein [Paenibacillus sp. CC-CFT747]